MFRFLQPRYCRLPKNNPKSETTKGKKKIVAPIKFTLCFSNYRATTANKRKNDQKVDIDGLKIAKKWKNEQKLTQIGQKTVTFYRFLTNLGIFQF